MARYLSITFAAFALCCAQSSFACATYIAGSKEARKQDRKVQALDRKLKHAKRQADTIVIGILRQTRTADDDDGGNELQRGVVEVAKVLKGTTEKLLKIEYYGWDGSCDPQFIPSEGETVKFYIQGGYIVAEERLVRS